MGNEKSISEQSTGRTGNGRASADHLDSQADVLWAYAGDCDRWGLGSDAEAARRKSVRMRVDAMVARALSQSGARSGDRDRSSSAQ